MSRQARKAPRVRPRCSFFLVGEGSSDIGDMAVASGYREGREGFLQPLVRRLLARRGLKVEFDGQKITRLPRRIGGTGLGALAQKAKFATLLALREGHAALVFCTDVDKATGEKARRSEMRRRHRELVAQIEAGVAAARAADPRCAAVEVLIACPCRMIEAWALGDPEALPAGEPLGRSPEELWGDEEDPRSNHPKRVLQRALSLDRPASPEDLAELAESIDLDALRRSCALSFGPFADALDAAVDRCDARQG